MNLTLQADLKKLAIPAVLGLGFLVFAYTTFNNFPLSLKVPLLNIPILGSVDTLANIAYQKLEFTASEIRFRSLFNTWSFPTRQLRDWKIEQTSRTWTKLQFMLENGQQYHLLHVAQLGVTDVTQTSREITAFLNQVRATRG
jgi:hypothetical protein